MLKYNIPDGNSKEVVADWVELFVTFSKDSISKTQLSSYIQASTGGEVDEAFLDSVWSTLRERIKLYGETPPINIERNLINSIIDWEQYPEYLACLIFSLEGNPNTPVASAAEAGKFFERISNEAIKKYLNGKSLIYGFPNDQDIEEIANNVLLEKFNHLPPSYRKDRNLDIIAWIPWQDGRASQVVLFVQCAAGGNWKTKLKELNVRAWEKYIDFAAPLLKGFSVPVFISAEKLPISDKEYLNELSTDAGVMIDRPRLYRGTYNFAFSDATLRPALLAWCNDRITELNN